MEAQSGIMELTNLKNREIYTFSLFSNISLEGDFIEKKLIVLFVFFAILLIFIIYINADKKVLLDNPVHSDDVTKSIKEIEITDLLSQEKVFHILIKGEQFYYSTINYNNSGSKEVFFIENSNQLGFPSEVYTCDMSQREILALNTDSFNNLYLLEAYYKNTCVEYTILKISDTGALIYRNSVAIQDAPTTGRWQLSVKPDECIILYINQNIYEITSAGAINNSWVSNKDLLSIICTKNDQLFAIIYENGYKKSGNLLGKLHIYWYKTYRLLLWNSLKKMPTAS